MRHICEEHNLVIIHIASHQRLGKMGVLYLVKQMLGFGNQCGIGQFIIFLFIDQQVYAFKETVET